MRSLERGGRHESLEKSISAIAFAYGFTMPPAVISKKTAGAVNADPKTALAISVMKQKGASPKQTQLWGGMRTSRGTMLSFAALSKNAIGNALIVKTALSIAERAGFSSLEVLVSSVGDQESRRRFSRELTNFFKKNLEAIPAELKPRALNEPDATYRELLNRKDPLIERAPRAIDYLSENSRKTMLETLSLFESVGIPYTIDARLQGEPNMHAELIFAIDALEKDGTKTRLAHGGRYDDAVRKNFGITGDSATAISLSLPKDIDLEATEESPTCFVVHVGDAAKLKAFVLLEALWKAHVAVTQTLMSENFRDQIDQGKLSGAKYLAIIGQREALDSTIIIRNTSTQMQVTLPLDKLEGYVSRIR